MPERETVTETPKRWEGDFTVSVVDFIAELNALLADIPEQLRSDAVLEFSKYGDDYDSSYGTLEVHYERPATDDELRMWAASLPASERGEEARERAQFERLKQKFGHNS